MAQEYTANYWLQKGDQFYKNNSYDLALRCYNKAIEINPLEADVWHNKGDILKELGRSTEADAAFAKAEELTASKTSDVKSTSTIDASASRKDKQAEYMKTIFVSKEGYDGITIYFILADKNGVSIASDGKLELSITGKDTGGSLFQYRAM
jgi:tetratricopeptide (TPR) repeat protein